MDIIQKPCAAGNWRAGRKFSATSPKIAGLVIHVMDGYLAGTDALFNTAPQDRKGGQKGNPSSAHYGIGQGGEVHQYVQDADTAYHAGRVNKPVWPLIQPFWNDATGKYSGVNPNSITIGIEHEGAAGQAFAAKLKLAFEWPDAMVQASAELIATLCVKHSIPIERGFIVGHHEIFQPKPCPGDLAIVDRLVALAKTI